MNSLIFVVVLISLATATYAVPAATAGTAPANDTGTPVPASTSPSTESSSKPEYPKDLGNGVEMINREDCPGGYCETFLIRPPPPGMQQPMGGMGMQGGNPCCPQLPPSPCGGQQQPSCQLGPPPSGCQGPCPQGPPMQMAGR